MPPPGRSPGPAVGVPAFQVGSGISLTSNGFRTGTIIAGGSLDTFDGFWYADLSFNLPSNATNVALTFSGFFGDDRAVLQRQ